MKAEMFFFFLCTSSQLCTSSFIIPVVPTPIWYHPLVHSGSSCWTPAPGGRWELLQGPCPWRILGFPAGFLPLVNSGSSCKVPGPGARWELMQGSCPWCTLGAPARYLSEVHSGVPSQDEWFDCPMDKTGFARPCVLVCLHLVVIQVATLPATCSLNLKS